MLKTFTAHTLPNRLLSIGVMVCAMLLANPSQALLGFASEQPEVIVHTAFIDIRKGPGDGFAVFHIAEKGEIIKLTKRRSQWYRIELQSKQKSQGTIIGWVKRDDLNGAKTPDGKVLSFPKAGFEEYRQRQWDFGVMLGNFSSAQSFTVLGGYHFTQNMSTELKLSQSYGDFSNTQMWSVHLVSLPFDHWRVAPFFSIGAGQLYVSPHENLVQSEDRTEGTMNIGTGVLYNFSRRFIFRAEYTYHTVLTNRTNNEQVNEWKAGFSVFY